LRVWPSARKYVRDRRRLPPFGSRDSE